jgi:uncharacterized membrane protein (UPF0182 family)
MLSRRRRAGSLQVEARLDQNAQLSGQLTLWNRRGSHVRRGPRMVIPTGRALFYAEPIYVQADRSPLPESRLVVLALQDRLAYGPKFQAGLALFLAQAFPPLLRQSRRAPPGICRRAPAERLAEV